MSDQRAPRPDDIDSWLTFLMVAVGIVLLAPGLCSLVFSVVWMRDMLFNAVNHRVDAAYRLGDWDGVALLIILAGTAIGAIGVGIIVFAIPRRSPRVPALLMLAGIILLLPGFCSLILSAIRLAAGRLGGDPGFQLLLAFGISIGAGGLAFIVIAIRRYRSRSVVQ
jgi:hypothetical protein